MDGNRFAKLSDYKKNYSPNRILTLSINLEILLREIYFHNVSREHTINLPLDMNQILKCKF